MGNDDDGTEPRGVSSADRIKRKSRFLDRTAFQKVHLYQLHTG